MAITDPGDNTSNVFIDALAAYSFLDIGGDRNITYTFATGGNISSHPWASLTEKVQWQNALQQWVNVANITTQEVFSSDADLREAWVDTGQMTVAHGLGPDGLPYPSYHDLPQSGVGGPNGMYNRGYNTSFFPAAGVTTGGSGYWAFLHEIGRGLGLTPPFGTQDLENEPLFPGVTVSADLGDFGYDQMVYTALSNNRGQYISGGNSFGYPVTPMAFDIAAIQFLYGPNTTFHSGSDGYGLPDEHAPGTTWQCIWDTGGTDTILYDGKKNATIDLRAATLVNGDPIAGGAISKVDGIFGGLTIANGVVIENASGGSGNDTIRGNSADNVLVGNAGDDTAVFSGNRSSYAIENLGNRVVVTGPDGTDTLFSIEHAKFDDTTVNLNAPAAPASAPTWSLTGVRDLTGDGTSDVVWYNSATGRVDLWKIANGQWAGSVDLWKISNGQWAGSIDVGPHPLGWQPIGTGDFDHDGTDDVAWYNSTTRNIDIWQIVNGHWTASSDVGAHPAGWAPAGIGDFNHDGTDDIAWYNPTTGNIDIWQIVNGHWNASSDVGSQPAGWAPSGIGDFNDDGSSDIAWYNSASGNVDIWQIVNAHWAGSTSPGSHPLF